MGRPIWSTGRTGGLGGDVRAELWIGEGRGWGFERQCAWFEVTGPARGLSRRVRSVRQISIGRYFSRRSDLIRGDVAGRARRNGSNGHSQSSRCGRRAGRRWTCRRSRRGWTLLSLSSRVEVISADVSPIAFMKSPVRLQTWETDRRLAGAPLGQPPCATARDARTNARHPSASGTRTTITRSRGIHHGGG